MTADPRRKLHVPPEWQAAASDIFERGLRTVLCYRWLGRRQEQLLPVFDGSAACAVGRSGICRGRYRTERDKVSIVQFGDVYVTPEGGEIGEVKWAW